jgi:uridine kinase
MIGISGLARAGKDTLAKSLKTIIEKEWGCEVEIIHLADTLKLDSYLLNLILMFLQKKMSKKN